MAEILEIVHHDQNHGSLTSLDRFQTAAAGTVRSAIVIEHDHITPLCLDHDARRLIFADLPPELDLSARPFAFVDQKRSARRLIAVPYAELSSLSARVTAPSSLVFVFNSARSGSTLLHQILNEVHGVQSFSELDFFGNFVPVAHRSGDQPELAELLRHCVTLFAYPSADKTVAFKFRSDVIDVAGLFHQAFPAAANIFLYRNAIDWSASWWRMHLESGAPEVVDVSDRRADWVHRTGRSDCFDRVVPPDETFAPIYLAMLPLWLAAIEGYLRHQADGVPFLTVRYEDLNESRPAVLSRVLDHIGIPEGELDAALRGFDGDSQAGTGLERSGGQPNDVTIDRDVRQAIVDVLARQPVPLTPDVFLPGTITP